MQGPKDREVTGRTGVDPKEDERPFSKRMPKREEGTSPFDRRKQAARTGRPHAPQTASKFSNVSENGRERPLGINLRQMVAKGSRRPAPSEGRHISAGGIGVGITRI